MDAHGENGAEHSGLDFFLHPGLGMENVAVAVVAAAVAVVLIDLSNRATGPKGAVWGGGPTGTS